MYTYLKFGLPRVMPMGLEEVYKYQTNLFSLNWLKANRSDSILYNFTLVFAKTMIAIQ